MAVCQEKLFQILYQIVLIGFLENKTAGKFNFPAANFLEEGTAQIEPPEI